MALRVEPKKITENSDEYLIDRRIDLEDMIRDESTHSEAAERLLRGWPL
jgi:hypothetical protein